VINFGTYLTYTALHNMSSR